MHRPDQNELNGDSGAMAHNFATLAVHAGYHSQFSADAVVEPICLSTTFSRSGFDHPPQYAYTRSGNPNRASLEEAVAALEQGQYATVYSSGLSAIATVTESLPPGSHIISTSDLYGGTHRYFAQICPRFGMHVTFTSDLELDFLKLIRKETKLVYIETPSNPTLKVIDIGSVSNLAHANGIKVAVDNTFLSPYIQRPLRHGADFVVHSVSKYLSGHSDVLMGAVIVNDPVVQETMRFLQKAIGSVPSPFDCWLAHRGLKTLHLRIEASNANAHSIAEDLQSSPQVIEVYYPGLKSHPKYGTVVRQHRNAMGGGVVSFRLKGGKQAAEIFCRSLTLFNLAVSLGGVESLVEIPSLMTHSNIPEDHRKVDGVSDDLIRLSCGIEDREDLRKDVVEALKKAASVVEESQEVI